MLYVQAVMLHTYIIFANSPCFALDYCIHPAHFPSIEYSCITIKCFWIVKLDDEYVWVKDVDKATSIQ